VSGKNRSKQGFFLVFQVNDLFSRLDSRFDHGEAVSGHPVAAPDFSSQFGVQVSQVSGCDGRTFAWQ
jgi:hypothetical protein